ncbi:hypothetical protein FORMB_15460 [Formosa sp. Hel1_33_131]|uniref:hypothetical protein n=1 Tax=Formosa sp. Hel1_33_131 TaxID=1336794 RepID=UPI000865E7E8|nr:hypothetical protein [Formosa sp. Hel1_33_131]AOR28586.1 hypothetical protein FORMB_15460 [Formosa sp. Hel1_33_131]
MKKMKLILLLTIVTFSCKTEDVKKELISEFIEKVILDKSYNIDNINEYLDLEKDSLIPDSELLKFLNFNIDFLRGEIKDMKQLDIMSYKDFIDNEKFSSYNINYPKSEDVFFVVKKNKLITSIIVSDDTKILSFFTGLIKHKDNINPYMINKR